jgi:hypothetical protein
MQGQLLALELLLATCISVEVRLAGLVQRTSR